jgi:hypothetical protein
MKNERGEVGRLMKTQLLDCVIHNHTGKYSLRLASESGSSSAIQ